MKKILLGTVALVAMVGSASAADLAARPAYTKAPPMIAAAYDWSGFYIGANGGYGTSSKSLDFVTAAGLVAADGSHTASGGTAGGQIGYRWQSGAMVYGLEGQGNWADFGGTNISPILPTSSNRTRVDAFGLFTGQIGYSWNNALLYVKGGGAVVGQRYDGFFTATGPGSAGSVTGRETRLGATVGAGLEFGFTPNWSVGVEYNHIFLGTTSYALAGGAQERVRGDIDMVTARLNYRWGGPVVARY
jgi:outer membrane immunogenic protein